MNTATESMIGVGKALAAHGFQAEGTSIVSHLERASKQHPEHRMEACEDAIGHELRDDVIRNEYNLRFRTEKAAAAGEPQQQPQQQQPA